MTANLPISQSPNLAPIHSPDFAGVLTALLAQRTPIYIVGGAVRDFLLGRDGGVTDLDLALAGPVLPAARRVADRLGWAYYPLDAERDVARIVLPRENAPHLVCDLAALRGDLAADLALRDFTINALALELTGDAPPRLVDLCGGVDDIHARRIRAVSSESLAADPIRLLRAVRFAGQLHFDIETETEAQIQRLAPRITETSPERQRDELWKILSLPRPGQALTELHRLGLLVYVLPEAAHLDGVAQSEPHRLDVLRHTALVMDYAAKLRDWLTGGDDSLLEPALAGMLTPWRNQLADHFAQDLVYGRSRAGWLVWHALFHDTGKPACASEEMDETGQRRIRFFGHEDVSAQLAETRTTELHFSRRETQVAQAVVTAHMRPHHLLESFADGNISRRACHRFLRDTAIGGSADRTGLDVLLLALADRLAPGKARGNGWQAYLTGIRTLLEYAFAPSTINLRPLVDGRKLMQTFDLAPGRLVGSLLESILEAQAAGDVSNEDEALALAADLIRR